MTTNLNAKSKRPSPVRMAGLVGLALLVLGVVAFVAKGGFGKKGKLDEAAYYAVKRGDLTVAIMEGGALRALNEAQVRSQFASQVRIIWLIQEGTYVNKGDKLVELDSADLKERVNTSRINLQTALFSYELAKGNLDIQKSQNESTIKNQELTVEFAASDLEKYKDGDAPQAVKDALSAIQQQQEFLVRDKETADNTKELADKGFATQTKLKADVLAADTRAVELDKATARLHILTNYDQPKQLRRYQANLENAKAELGRLKLRLDATYRQSESDLATRKRSLELTQEQLDEQEKQLAAATIYAPQPGLVVYGSSGGTTLGSSSQTLIEEGAMVSNQRILIRLPDVSKMLVDLRVHESHILQVHNDLPAYVTIDSIPDRQFKGHVYRVGVLPDSTAAYSNPNLKVYQVQVMIDETLPDIKPGVSARAEIIVTNLVDKLVVPIQAVTTHKGQQVVYVSRGGEAPVPVPVAVGLFNEQFIDVLKGLTEGDRVLLSPPSSSETSGDSGETARDSNPGAGGATTASLTPALP